MSESLVLRLRLRQGGLKAGPKLGDHQPKVSVSVSKFETDSKSISIKFLDHNAKVSVSVSMFETDDGLSLCLNFLY